MKIAIVIGLTTLSFKTLAYGGMGMDNFIEQQVKYAKQLFNQEFKSANTPTIKVAEKVIWPNRALGCPRDDANYTQVLTDGIRIVLSLNGKDYPYHGDSKGKLFYCESDRTVTPYRSGWQAAGY